MIFVATASIYSLWATAIWGGARRPRVLGRETMLRLAHRYSYTYVQLFATDTENAPPFTEREVEACLKNMSTNKAPGPDQITSDVYKLGGEQITKGLTKCFNKILETKTIPPSWNEAKIIILYKKGDPDDIKNYRPISLLAHSYNYLPDCCKREWRRCLIEINHENKQDFAKNFQQ